MQIKAAVEFLNEFDGCFFLFNGVYMILDEVNELLEKSIKNRSHLVPKVIIDKNGHKKTVLINPIDKETQKKNKAAADAELDRKYLAAVNSGNIELVQKMVIDRAIEKGFKDAIPEQGNGYKIRTTKPPKKTKTYYKCFYVDEFGRPSALFVDNNAALPTNVWLSANDTYHFEAENGSNYVPTMGNANNKDANKTGMSIKIPNDTVRQELIKRGYLPEGSTAQTITCVAYRPGWHGGDLPFFPQGGKYGNHPLNQNGKENRKYNPDLPESPYKNVHRWNQVIFEIEVDADKDYTEEAKAQPKAWSKKGEFIPDRADLQYMPEGGMYEYTTNPEVEKMTGGKGKWVISGAIKIKRALSEKECNEILKNAGMPAQEWESKPDPNKTDKERDAEKLNLATMSLENLGYTGTELSAARKTLAPITYDNHGNIIPLSQRFNKRSKDIRKSINTYEILTYPGEKRTMKFSIDTVFAKSFIQKSLQQDEFKKLKAEVLNILKKQEKEEQQDVKKAIMAAEKSYSVIVKSIEGKWVQKSGYPVGTIRVWKGQKYIKIAPNKWKPQYDNESRGAKNSATRLIHKIEQCKDIDELMNLVMANKQRFVDANGNHLPIVDKIRAAADKKNNEISSGKSPAAKEEPKKPAEKYEVPEKDKKSYADAAFYRKQDLLWDKENGKQKTKLKDLQAAKNSMQEQVDRWQTLIKENTEDMNSGKISEDQKPKFERYNAHYTAQIDAYQKQMKYLDDEIEGKQKKAAENKAKRDAKKQNSLAENVKNAMQEPEKVTKTSSVKDWYKKTYPDDDLGDQLRNVSFKNIYDRLKQKRYNYDDFANDSVIRQRIFSQIAELEGKDYNDIYNMWLDSEEYDDETEESNAEKKKNPIDIMDSKQSQEEVSKLKNKYGCSEEFAEYVVEQSEAENRETVDMQKADELREYSIKKFISNFKTPKEAIDYAKKYDEKMVEDGGAGYDWKIEEYCEEKGIDINEPEESDAEKKQNRSDAMKGNKNAYKGGPKEEENGAKKETLQEEFDRKTKASQEVRFNQEHKIENMNYDKKFDNLKVNSMDKLSKQMESKGYTTVDTGTDKVKIYVDEDKKVKAVIMSNDDFQKLWKESKEEHFKFAKKEFEETDPKDTKAKEHWYYEMTNYDDPTMDLKKLGVDDYIAYKISRAMQKGKLKVVDTMKSKESKTDSEDARQKGKTLADVKKAYSAAKSVTGNKKTVHVGDEKIKCHYKLVEADTPQASHNETTFEMTPGFPQTEGGKTVNDRDYGKDKSAQEGVRSIAAKYDGRALEDPPIVTKDGIVLSGNNRTMSSKLAAKNGTDSAYMDELKDVIEDYGIDEDELKNFKHPRIVLEMDDYNGNYSTADFAKFNKSGQKTKNNTEKAVEISKTIKPQAISSLADKMSEFDTLAEMWNNKNACIDFTTALVTNGVLQPNELAQYTREDGTLNDTGKDFVETIMIGSVLNEDNIRSLDSAGGRKLRQKLVRAIVPLIDNKGLGNEYTFNNELNKAVSIAAEVTKNPDTFGSVQDYLAQGNMFEEKPDELTAKLADIVYSYKEKEFADKMRELEGGLRPSANGEFDIFLGECETRDSILDRILQIRTAVKKAISNIVNMFKK